MHAFVRRGLSLGARRKLSGAPHRESAAGGFDMGRPRLELLQAMDLSVHPLQGGGEYLLALQGMLGRARETLSSRPALAARLPTFGARQRALLLAHVAQALAQGL